MKVSSAPHMSFCKEKYDESAKLLFTWMILPSARSLKWGEKKRRVYLCSYGTGSSYVFQNEMMWYLLNVWTNLKMNSANFFSFNGESRTHIVQPRRTDNGLSKRHIHWNHCTKKDGEHDTHYTASNFFLQISFLFFTFLF